MGVNYYQRNRARIIAAVRARRAANPEQSRAQGRAWRAKNAEHVKAYRRGYTPKYRDRRRVKQGLPEPTRPCPVICECCGRPPKRGSLHLDHDHETGRFRGWLCNSCNRALGMLGDTVDGLLRALDYMSR